MSSFRLSARLLSFRTLLHRIHSKEFSGFEFPKGRCTQIVYTLAPKYLYGDLLGQSIYYLGTWTLRPGVHVVDVRSVAFRS